MDMSEESAAWIEGRYIDWQRDRKKRGTLTDFAAWMGVSRNLLNNWINRKQTPEGASVALLASKLGPEIYSIVGMTPPDPRLQAIEKRWGKLSEEAKNALSADAERYASVQPDGQLAAPKRKSKG